MLHICDIVVSLVVVGIFIIVVAVRAIWVDRPGRARSHWKGGRSPGMVGAHDPEMRVLGGVDADDDIDDGQRRTIKKMVTICSEGDLYVSAQVAEAIMKAGPNHVAAHFDDEVFNLHVRKANHGGYQLQWKKRSQNLWQDKWGAVWQRST